jgi:FkbM family methyltransferase
MLKYFVLKILGVFDFYHQLKIFRFLKKKDLKNFNIFFDIGAHKGESINLFLKNLNIKKIYSFESSPVNYLILKNNLPNLQRKFKKTIININNLTLGSESKEGTLKQIDESSSSTLNNININSKYFKRKKALVYNKKNQQFYKEIKINISTLSNYLKENNIDQVDFIKIDTEGYEYEILKGLNKQFSKIRLIMFEHHYHDMLEKGYTFTDIHGLLGKNNFIQFFKAKMPFRKTFEYIYINKEKM